MVHTVRMPVTRLDERPVPCPCGCDRQISKRRLGPATQYPELVSLLHEVTPALDWFTENDGPGDDWPVHQLSAEKARNGCLRVLQYHLDHLHGTAHAGRTPDVGMLLWLTAVARQQLDEVVATSRSLGGPGMPRTAATVRRRGMFG